MDQLRDPFQTHNERHCWSLTHSIQHGWADILTRQLAGRPPPGCLRPSIVPQITNHCCMSWNFISWIVDTMNTGLCISLSVPKTSVYFKILSSFHFFLFFFSFCFLYSYSKKSSKFIITPSYCTLLPGLRAHLLFSLFLFHLFLLWSLWFLSCY